LVGPEAGQVGVARFVAQSRRYGMV
jgi:hypothetical protein